MYGKVVLVGTGPGDPGLVTQKAVECIHEADVLVYDRLIPGGLLIQAKEGAEKIFAGKQPGGHTMSQEQINALLVNKAKQGKLVARLKGGDPFVFGRGGEEALALQEENVEFEVIPGVTSAVSAPMYAGIPLTHRGISSSFTVVTGHEDPMKKESAIQWDQLAKTSGTLCFLMGVGNLEKIASALIRNGRNPDTPVALIRWGTRPHQETLTGTLADIPSKVQERKFKAPAVIVVGEVVSLRHKISWYENKPLFGKTVIVTRARSQASVLSRQIQRLGGDPIEVPAIKISSPESFRDLDEALGNIESYSWVVFTSANGVDKFFQRLESMEKDSRKLGKNKIAAIGTGTEKALKTKGIHPDVVPKEFRAEALINALKGRVQKGEKILIPRAKEAREILPQSLKELGLEVEVVTAYETIRENGEALTQLKHLLDIQKESNKEDHKNKRQLQAHAITFTSSSTVRNFMELLLKLVQLEKDLTDANPARYLDQICVACIGPITASTCWDFGIEVNVVAEEYTIEGLLNALIRYLKRV